VIRNLLDNAVKYSPDGGPIEVEVAGSTGDEAPGVRVEVRDRGIGIPPEHRARIFDRFVQVHAGAHYAGFGLGLYISREIVERHGGAIRAEFPADGGTRFVVELPIRQEAD